MRAWLLMPALLLTTGCVAPGLGDSASCPAPDLAILHGEAPDDRVPRAADEPVAFLYWATNPTNGTADLWATTLPAPEGVLDPDAHVTAAGVQHTTGPGEAAFGGYAYPVSDRDDFWFQAEVAATEEGPCGPTGVAPHPFNLTAPMAGDRAEAGKGVLVHTAGFWTNGTSFYTNIDRVHERADIPKGYAGPYGGGDPLKVYVYNESADEVPPRYERAGFVPTIRGFNDALKGISTTAPRIVYIQPEDAYTREGREDHALYGDALVFYIEAIEVVEVPCEVPDPVCDVPAVPPSAGAPGLHG